MGGRDGCDGNYEVGAYGMKWVHNNGNRPKLVSQYNRDIRAFYIICAFLDIFIK